MLPTSELITEARTKAAGMEFSQRWLVLEMAKRLETATSIDAVPVVRCKDCKRCTPTTDGFVCGHALPTKSLEQYFQTGTDIMAIVNPDDFCSYGERRGENNA